MAEQHGIHPMAELALAILAVACIVLALSASSCSVLPDRVYGEAQNNPWRGPDDEDLSFTFGVEYDLAPQEVVIAGQQRRHPWDVREALGIHDGDEPEGPVPLVVEDDRMAETLQAVAVALDELHGATVSNARTMDALAKDARAMREAFDRAEASWDAVNRTLLGGGGLGTLLLLLLGGRRIWPHKSKVEDSPGA